MSTFTATRCDGCGKEKGITNHWFYLVDTKGRLQIVGSMEKEVLIPHAPTDPIEVWRDVDAFDFCGATCLLKKVSELLPGLHA